MTVVICADDRGGLAFHHRRQSQDRAVRADLQQEAWGKVLWMTPYSQRQFGVWEEGSVRVSEALPTQGDRDIVVFLEDRDPMDYLPQASRLVVYRWNRHYPADRRMALPPVGWTLKHREEFPGFSHKIITKEVYLPCIR